MNIALFTDVYFPTKNGVVTVVDQLKQSLEENGHHVVIVTFEPNTPYTPDPNIYRAANSIPFKFGLKDFYLGIIWHPKLKKYLKKHKIQIIHCHSEFTVPRAGVSLAKKLHIPLVATFHTMWEDYYANYFTHLADFISVDIIRKLLFDFFKKFNCVISVSDKTRNYVKNELHIENPTVVIPNAIDQSKFVKNKNISKEEAKVQLGFKKDDIILLFVGRIAEEKRIYELVNLCDPVLKKVPNAKAVFVGDGPSLETVRNVSSRFENSDRYVFTGFKEWNEVSLYYQAGDIFMNASLTETYSMTTLEAMICGTPCVCRRDESITDRVIQGETGYLADTDEEMTEYLVKLCYDEETRKKMSENGKIVSQKFLPHAFVRRHELLYKTLIEKKGKLTMSDTEFQKLLDEVK